MWFQRKNKNINNGVTLIAQYITVYLVNRWFELFKILLNEELWILNVEGRLLEISSLRYSKLIRIVSNYFTLSIYLHPLILKAHTKPKPKGFKAKPSKPCILPHPLRGFFIGHLFGVANIGDMLHLFCTFNYIRSWILCVILGFIFGCYISRDDCPFFVFFSLLSIKYSINFSIEKKVKKKISV